MMTSANTYVYKFGGGKADGDKSMRDLLGGKGANLAEMSSIGLPVPPGFTISTEACNYYETHNQSWPAELQDQVEEGIAFLESQMNLKLGDTDRPLLVSVRSGAAASMPGMMDTVLNLGMNDDVVQALARLTGNERFAYDSYRRFIDMFGDVVMGVSHEHFEEAIEKMKNSRGVTFDSELTADDLKELVEQYKEIYRSHAGHSFPTTPREQLEYSINAVFNSWSSPRAKKYRQINKITGLLGTAVNVQSMVFGNMGERSGSGVCFTRNPSTGDNELYGEFLFDAQGEDVVAGIRTPDPVSSLQDKMPEVYDQLMETCRNLESHYQNMQDIEFTVQEGTLYILQTRNGKRTGPAAIKIAVDMVDEDKLDKRVAITDHIEATHLDQLLHPQFSEKDWNKEDLVGTGLPASPGAAVGQVYFTSDGAEKARKEGKQVILVRVETSPEDIGGMDAAEGVLTSRGGMTSHAAVVARGWGKPCVVGCDDISINYESRSFTNGNVTVNEGDWISMNGNNGYVIRGKMPLVEPELSGDFQRVMEWVDDYRTMNVRTNADEPDSVKKAREFGAEGIGLCRTEHMFFEKGRIHDMRRMILSDNEQDRRKALDKLLPYQREDFKGIFKAIEGYPVTIRLLDPPLHEFLPDGEKEIKQMAEDMQQSESHVRNIIDYLDELNPMLGHRGCRLGITYPEITEMQTRAIIEAALEARSEGEDSVLPEIMVPLVSTIEEFVNQKKVINDTAEQVFEERGERIDYQVGTMIEVPRATLMASEIAEEADFFSFGTNDLTQLTYGFSRDDVAKFLPYYIENKILPQDPFLSLDQKGVGQLIAWAVDNGRQTDSELKIGICGEHGGDPDSVEFCGRQEMHYVSCSPFRVPIARLASAKSQIKLETKVAEA